MRKYKFALIVVAAVLVVIFLGFRDAKKQANAPNEVAVSTSPTQPQAKPLNSNITLTPTPVKLGLREQIMADISVNGAPACSIPNACKIDAIEYLYARGTMPQRYWIAQFTNNKWVVVLTGNGMPKCQDVDKYQIPETLTPNCIEADGKLRY